MANDDPADGISTATARALRFRLAQAQKDGRVPSVVAAVARRGEPAWTGAAGSVDGVAPAPDVQYRVGSITKTMVAICMLRLVDAGRLDLADPIGVHLPESPAPESTIFQLLTHTAGLASETPPPWWERTPGTERPRLGDVLTPDPLRHPPGRVFHYSNPGFGILGELVSALTGRPWFDELAEHVLTPLGMTRTSYLPIEPYARGWAVHPWADVLLPEPTYDHGLLAGAGQVWSTPGDLCRLGVFLGGDGGGILTRTTLAAMRAPASEPAAPTWATSYGLGVQHLRFGERVVFGHTGSMPGFVAIMMTSLEDGLTVGIQANAWAELVLGEVCADLFAIVREREPTMPVAWAPAAAVEPSAYELVGVWYWGAVPTSITLRADGDLHLAGVGRRGRVARFTANGDGRWRGLDGYYDGEYLEVCRDAAGAITHLDLGSFVFTREPYAPADVVPDGVGDPGQSGGWQV